MAIPAYKNISGFSIDVPLDSGATQRVPPGYYVKGVYFEGVFDPHTTVVDGVTKTFGTDPNWEKVADSASVNPQSLIIVNNLPGYGNRLQLVDPPAFTYSPGAKGQVALDGTTIYLCTETGSAATTPTTVTAEQHIAADPYTEVTTTHIPTSVTEVKITGGAVIPSTDYTVDLETGVITFDSPLADPYTVDVSYVWAGPYPRWHRATGLATW